MPNEGTTRSRGTAGRPGRPAGAGKGLLLLATTGVALAAWAPAARAGSEPTTPPGSGPAPVLPPTASGQMKSPVAIETQFGWNNRYRLYQWQPVKVTVTNNGPAFTGDLWVKRPGLRDLEVWDHRDLYLSSGAAKEFWFYVRPEFPSTLLVVLKDKTGRTVQEAAPIFFQDSASPSARALPRVYRSDVLVGLIAPGLRSLPEAAPGQSLEKVFGVPLDLRELPDDPLGCASLDVVYWEDPDASDLDTGQAEALRSWVQGGGRLILYDGSGRRGAPPGAAAFFAGPGGRDLDLRKAPESRGEDLLRMTRSFFGSAGTLARDSDGNPFRRLDRAIEIHREALRRDARPVLRPFLFTDQDWYASVYLGLRPPPPVDEATGPMEKDRRDEDDRCVAYEIGQEVRFGKALKESLTQMASLKPLPVRFLLYFFGAYLLVVGPLDYLIARRAPRFERSWLLFPLAAVIFSIAAWQGTKAFKGRQSHTAALTFFDFEPGLKTARETTALCLVTPNRGRIRFSRASPGILDSLSRPDDKSLASVLGAGRRQPRLVAGPDHAYADMEPWTPRFFTSFSRVKFDPPPLQFSFDKFKEELETDNRLGFPLPVAFLVDRQKVRVYERVPEGKGRLRVAQAYGTKNWLEGAEDAWFFDAIVREWPEASRLFAYLVPDAVGAEAAPVLRPGLRRPFAAAPTEGRVLITFGVSPDHRFRVEGTPQAHRNLWVLRVPEE